MRTAIVGAMGLAGLMSLSGCGVNQTPRDRLGALPFPGPFTLYVCSEVSEVGVHHCLPWWERPFEAWEGARGIMYTQCGGFIDLAHLRECVDWTFYLRNQSRRVMQADGGDSIRFRKDDTDVEIEFRSPSWWADLDPAQRERLIDAASIRLGARAAYQLAVWHEIVTWCGYRSTIIVPEKGSAFTWDDLTSNLLGATVAEGVLREGERDFDRRATAAIRAALLELKPVTHAQVDRAAYAVEGLWWRDGVAVRRDLDTGLESGSRTPWLVPAMNESEMKPVVMDVPSLVDVEGFDLSQAFELRLTPRLGTLGRLCEARNVGIPIVAERDFRLLVDAVRLEVRAEWGADADHPAATTMAHKP